MTKFKLEDKVIFNGNEEIIKTAKKDFKNKSVIYIFHSGLSVSEKQLIKQNKQKEKENTIEDLRAKYAELYKKDVPYQKKNDAVWIEGKIKQKTPETPQTALTSEQKENALESLLVMDLSELKETAIKFDIKVEETDSTDELLKKICSVLEIDIDNI